MTTGGIPPVQDERWQQFTSNIDFCRRMVHSGAALENAAVNQLNLGDLSMVDYTDLYRAAWVQAVSALDHWLHREIISRAVALINDRPGDRPARLRAYPVTFETAELMTKRPIDEVMTEHLTERLGRDSYQKPDRIAEGLQYVTPRTQGAIWAEVTALVDPALTVEQLKARQTAIADRRNKIAHEADIDRRTGTRQPIGSTETYATIDWIEALAGAIRTLLR